MKMYKVLIVDDEPIIREGLKKIIDWNAHGFKIIADVSNGIEGYKKICSLNPDLCIIDIKMPGMDGLELIEKIKNQNITTKIIILTGYPEFEYAQKAIDLGVETYLLKPIDPNILLEKTKRIYLQLENERNFKNLVNRSIEFSKEKLMERLIKRDLIDISIEELNQIYNFDFPWKSYQVVLVEPNTETVVKEIKNIYSTYCFCIDNYIAILIKDISFPNCKKRLFFIKNTIKAKHNINITISIGKRVLQLADLYLSYESALNLIQKKFLYNQKGIIYPSEKEITFKILKEWDDNYILNEIIKSIELCDTNTINNILELKTKICLIKELSEEEIKTSYLNIYTNIVNYLSSNHIRFKEISINYLTEKIFNEFYKKKSLLELNNFMKGLLLDLIRNLSEITGKSLISKIIDYIESNYYKDLKIKDVAKNFGYNSCYFGKLFRKYTGECFNTYLDKTRINKAKELLIGGMKVVEVAEKVGYKDIDYFLYKFKKYVGKSPKNFREEIINSS